MVGATWLDDTWVYPVTIGDSPSGVSIGYGECLSGPTHILTMDYFVSGTSLPDCALRVLPHPERPFVEAADCVPNLIPATGGTSYLNSSLACQCEELPRPPYLDVFMDGLAFEATSTIRTFDIRNIGEGTLVWTVTDDQGWMSVSPASGSGDGTITVTADRSSLLSPGTHLGTISVESNGGRHTLLVSIYVANTLPNGIYVGVNPDNLLFGPSENRQTFMIANYRSNAAISWAARESVPWLVVHPSNGYATGTESSVTVYVDRTRLGSGNVHQTTIVIGTVNGDRLNRNPTVKIRVFGPREAAAPARPTTWGYVKALYKR